MKPLGPPPSEEIDVVLLRPQLVLGVGGVVKRGHHTCVPSALSISLPDSLSCYNAAQRMFTQSQASEVNCSELSISKVVIDSSLGGQRGSVTCLFKVTQVS